MPIVYSFGGFDYEKEKDKISSKKATREFIESDNNLKLIESSAEEVSQDEIDGNGVCKK